MDRDGYMNIKELCGIFKVEPKEGDYEKDGLIYCGKCNMPRQRYDDMPGGITDKLPAECLCEKAEREKRTAEEARVRHLALTAKNREEGIPVDLHRQTFTGARQGVNTEIMKLCRKYVDNFDRMLKEGAGLMFMGGVGSGKTFSAACIANGVIDGGYTVYFDRTDNITEAMTDGFGKNRDAIIERARRCDLLVLDDLGQERQTEAISEALYKILDARYQSGRPAVVTTNLSLGDLSRPADLTHSRIYDRLKRCRPIQITGKSLRNDEGGRIDRVIRGLFV